MWNSLRLRLTMIFIGLAVGPLLLVGMILAQRSFTIEREQALDLQRQVAQCVSTEIEAFLWERESELRLIGGEIRGLDRSDRAQELSLLLGMLRSGANRNVYEGLTLLDDQGQEQVRLSRREVIPTDELDDWSGAVEFEEPKSGGQTYFGPVWFDETTGEALMTIAVPLFELRSFRLRSVLVANVRFKTVGDLIAGLQVSEGQTIYVVDQEGKVVAHQDPSVELQDVRFESSERRIAQTGLNGTDVVLAVDEFQLGEQVLSVVAERPETEALEPAIHMVFTIAATVVVALVVASGLGFLVVRQIVRPIESLTTTARAISAGDLSQQVEVANRDEIGQLAETFNRMTAQLRDLFDSLEQRIAERKQAEEELRESQQFIENVANTAPLLLYVVDLSESRVIYANSQFITQLGYTPEQMRIEVVSERFVHPGGHAVIEETLACIARAKDGEIIEAEFQSKRASGEWRWLHNRSIVLSRNPDGSVKQYLGTILDITERKRAEEALKTSESEKRSILNAISDIVLFQDMDMIIRWGNEAAARSVGKTQQELVGCRCYELWHGRSEPCEECPVLAVLETGSYASSSIMTTPGGRWWEITGEPVHDRDGKIVGAIEIARDITERKQAEKELQESEEKFRTFTESAPVAIMIYQNYQCIYANPAAETITGYTNEELLSMKFWDVGHPDSKDLIEEWSKAIAREESVPKQYELRVVAKDGSEKWIDGRLELIEYEGKRAALISAIDITERKLMEEALRLKDNAMASSIDAIAIAEFAGNLTYVNASFLRMWGYDDESKVLGKPAVGFWQMEENAEVVVEALRDRQSWTGELVAKRRDGSLFDVQVSASMVTDETGKPICMMSSFVDVTERKRMEEALRESEEKYRQLFELESDAIFLIDNETDRILEVNAAGLALYGYSREELLQKRNTDISAEPDKTRKATMERWSQVPVRFHRKKNGTVFPVEITGRHFTRRGREVHIAAIRDIAKRVQVEEERELLLVQIRAQAQRVQQIVDTVPEGVLLLDADGRAVLANPVAEGDIAVLADAEVGDTLTHLGDRSLEELLTSPPSGRWHEVKADERTFEIIARPMEPATRPTADARLLNGDSPEPGDWVLVINDVTREREIQRRVQQQERLAAVGQLAAGIAHDFNNIMATIVLYAQMTARTEGLPATVQERMTTINQQAQHATRLIQQILDFGRRAVLERQPLDLLPLLKEQVKLLKRTLPESIEIELAYGPDEYTINADPTRMQQMVTNLAVNARDAMPEGGSLRIGLERIRIEGRKAAPLPEMKAGEWVQVTVSDTGTGIPPDVLPHIYEPFFTTRAPLGSGLGLSQVHGIVAQHEGHIDVETQLGQGTTFIIYLPALPIRQPEPSTLGTGRLIQGEGQTILVVEDSAAIRKALVESLQVLNYQAMEASNGQEALAVLEQHDEEIALVLSDVVMPEMGGIALLRSMRQNGLAMPVVMLTGHPLKKELENLRAQGMVAWLVKPPSLEQLAEVVAQALS
jgi:two-component system cell cycle sensor histidine kinase/response regulator CckA